MSKFKKNIKAGLPIIVTYILNYIIIIISALIYNLLGNDNVDFFINQICPYILNIYYIVIILYLYKRNYHKEPRLCQYFPNIYLGISLAIFLNMLIFKLFPVTDITTISIPLAIISSGIIGPIYEEILFRYVFYNRLKKFNSKKISLFITNTVFALIHISPIKMCYSFIIGLILNIVYERNQNILSPILIHIAANIIVIFLQEYNTYILILSLINLFLSIRLILKK